VAKREQRPRHECDRSFPDKRPSPGAVPVPASDLSPTGLQTMLPTLGNRGSKHSTRPKAGRDKRRRSPIGRHSALRATPYP
jgi:hypothetical protein